MKKIPLRKCVATQEQLPKKDLIRVVKNNEGQVFVDLTGKQNGRGAYLKRSKEAIEIAKKKNSLGRALEIEIKEEIKVEVKKETKVEEKPQVKNYMPVYTEEELAEIEDEEDDEYSKYDEDIDYDQYDIYYDED